MPLPLGKHQHHMLVNVERIQGGRWWPGCPLTLHTLSRSRIVLDSLVARGLMTHTGSCHYAVTDLGQKMVQEFDSKHNE